MSYALGPAFAGWRFVPCFLDETRNIAGLPRLSYSLGIQRWARAFFSASSQATRGIAVPEMANISAMLFFSFYPG